MVQDHRIAEDSIMAGEKIDLQVKMIIMHLIDNDDDDAVVPRHKRKRLTIDNHDTVIGLPQQYDTDGYGSENYVYRTRRRKRSRG
jgi:hypothetical protein